MNCDRIKKYVDDYFLDELDQAVEMKVSEHLTKCPQCQKEFEKKEALINRLKDSLKLQPSQGVYKRIRTIVKNDCVREKIKWWGLPRQFVYAAAAFLLGVVLMRAIDTIISETEQHPQVEMRYEVPEKADTVQFYSAPPKHLARML
jgi:anti-sigma factor RsiW